MPAKGKGALRIAIEDFLQTFRFGKIIADWFKEWGEDQEQAITDTHAELFDILNQVEGVPDALKNLPFMSRDGSAQGAILTAAGFAAQIGSQAAGGLMSPVIRLLNYWMDDQLRTARVDPATAWAIARRSPELSADALDGLSQLGYSDNLIQAYRYLTEQIIADGDLFALWLRGELGDAELHDRLAQRGWNDERINYLKQLQKIIPGVGDLINMAVREAFDDGVAATFGYDEAFPEQAAEWAEKQGLDREWFKRYWRSHWRLPSVGQAFEMFQRLRPGRTDVPFTQDHLQLLLRALDLPGFWRQRLTEIAYTPLTRVDVRRMYSTGTLDESGVYQAYLDYGSSPRDAELMTDFTIKYETANEQELSRTVIIKAFKNGMFTRSEAVQALTSTGHPNASAEFYVSIAELELYEDRVNQELKYIETLYVNGEIDQSEVYDYLGPLDLTSDQMHKQIKEWDIKIKSSLRLPTENELEDFYIQGIISDQDYRDGLKARRYKNDSIDWYVQKADMEIAENKAKELERERKEQERLEQSSYLNEYRSKVAEINVEIAELQSDIAGIKLAIHEIEEDELLLQLAQTIDAIKFQIKELRVEKAELSLDKYENQP